MVFASQSRSLYDFTIVSAWVGVTETLSVIRRTGSLDRCLLPWDRPIYRETSAILSASSVHLAFTV